MNTAGVSAPPLAAPATSTRNPNPTRTRPRPNFNGTFGSSRRLASQFQPQAKTGASRMIKAELTDRNTDAGTSQPKITRSTRSSVNMLSDDPVCSNNAQNSGLSATRNSAAKI